MLQEVEQFIKRHHLIQSGQTIVVGVSGGPDSMALLHYLWNRRKGDELNIIAAHVDHMLRGSESAEDLLYVQSYCRENDIQFEGKRLDVAAYKKENRLTSTQSAARECRYAFYAEVMAKHKADSLALAHHGDDQTETILMRMTRGGSGTALGGMQAKRSFEGRCIIRPFLGITKDEIEHYCKVHTILPRRDPSNEGDDYVRNRFRHHVLPFLKKENPNVHLRFQQISETFYEDETYLMEQAKRSLETVVTVKKASLVEVSAAKFLSMPIPLQKRAITLILNYLYKQTPSSLSSLHKESFLTLLGSEHPSGKLDFPRGLQVIRSYDRCRLTFGTAETIGGYQIELKIPGTLNLPAGVITAEYKEEYPDEKKGKDVFVCDVKSVSLPIIARTRKPGDRIAIQGVNGTRKVKDIFIDQKLERDKREIWPVLEDGKGNIIWIPGIKHAAVPRSSEPKQWLVLQFQNFCQDV
ncbi:tRNA lysidine(34) synthetase TilS [Fictibacillus terranigra]|uniref:tRNA(Ile)-lysidine synthase n=1 Tax=Fictibacillus terranigra TaxID=3058424 RepID=A0ABT8EEB4_9BACL|nr:tRNA lysidine(34) synthetase TilS [Fictibacillus sp. CENA-BCM004]MDN4076260.1 tRNA lysidine(34) synthetase TilS [Fictibacillus sp. CENA-BCM004]